MFNVLVCSTTQKSQQSSHRTLYYRKVAQRKTSNEKLMLGQVPVSLHA